MCFFNEKLVSHFLDLIVNRIDWNWPIWFSYFSELSKFRRRIKKYKKKWLLTGIDSTFFIFRFDSILLNTELEICNNSHQKLIVNQYLTLTLTFQHFWYFTLIANVLNQFFFYNSETNNLQSNQCRCFEPLKWFTENWEPDIQILDNWDNLCRNLVLVIVKRRRWFMWRFQLEFQLFLRWNCQYSDRFQWRLTLLVQLTWMAKKKTISFNFNSIRFPLDYFF